MRFNVTATKASSLGYQDPISLAMRNVAGQSGGGFGFLSDIAPAPEWIGNFIVRVLARELRGHGADAVHGPGNWICWIRTSVPAIRATTRR